MINFPKNLVLTNKRNASQLWYVSAPWNKDLSLKRLGRYLKVKQGRFRFAKP